MHQNSTINQSTTGWYDKSLYITISIYRAEFTGGGEVQSAQTYRDDTISLKKVTPDLLSVYRAGSGSAVHRTVGVLFTWSIVSSFPLFTFTPDGYST